MTETCIYIEVVTDVSTNNQGSLLTAIDNVFGSRSTELPSQSESANQVPADAQIGRPEHNRAKYRLSLSENVSAAVDGLENAISNNPTIDWYEIRTHSCQHDLSTGEGTGECPDSTVAQNGSNNPATSGTVPSDV